MKNERYKRFYLELVDDGSLTRKSEEQQADILDQQISDWARLIGIRNLNFSYRIINCETVCKDDSAVGQRMSATIRYVVHIAYTL